jgi:curved DNA-binding protein CbpA
LDKYYKTLDISTDATENEIKKAYRDLVKVWHPDRFTHDIELQKKAEDKLKEINIAYRKIIDQLHRFGTTNSYHQTYSQTYPNYQASPKSDNSWVCPECLKINLDNLFACTCGFTTSAFHIRAYSINQSPRELYSDVLFNKKMGDTSRVDFLTKYLLKRFSTSPEADLVRRSASSARSSQDNKKEEKISFSEKIRLRFIRLKKSDEYLHLKKYWPLYILAGIFAIGYLRLTSN